MSRQDYWRMCIPELLGQHGLDLPADKMDAIADDIAQCAEMESEAMGYTNIPNPLQAEVRRLQETIRTVQDTADRREEIFRRDIANRISPKTDSLQVSIQDGRVVVRERR